MAQRFLIVIAACVLILSAVRLAAQQQPTPQPQPPGLQVLIAQGELVQVDVDARTLTIRTVDANQMQFRYTDATKVTGAEEGAAGLATKTGSQLIVKYSEQGRTNIATEIEVQAKS